MASIVKRSKSFCVVYNTYESGRKRQVWETYHSEEMALRRKAQIEMIQAIQKESAERKNLRGKETLEDFMVEYVEVYGRIHWSCSTYTSNCALIKNYIIPRFGSMRFSEFTPRTVAALYSDLLTRQQFAKPAYSGRIITPQLLASIHKLMHSAFEQAVLWDYIDKNPFHKIHFPEAFPKTPAMLSPEEIGQLMRECNNPMLLMALHLAFAGSLRKGEILALTWDNVDFKNNSITVTKTLKRVTRESLAVLDGKEILYEFPGMFPDSRTVMVLKQPKTRSSIRTVYLPEYVMNLLRDWKAQQPPCKHAQPDLLFRRSNGWPFQEETLPDLLEKELLAQALPKVTFHSLRHSSITYKLMLTGGNIKAVQGDSGHAQAEMITERYGHVIDSSRKDSAQKFQDKFYKKL